MKSYSPSAKITYVPTAISVGPSSRPGQVILPAQEDEEGLDGLWRKRQEVEDPKRGRSRLMFPLMMDWMVFPAVRAVAPAIRSE